MTAYYNEHDPYCAQWLRNLIDDGQIAHGDVDERDIRDVLPSDLTGYTQCHFFAGVGVWSLALKWSGWPDDRPVWTGSCPCQPFSKAGQGAGFDDERHLWPAWYHLIGQCRPSMVFGEQVEGSAGYKWLDIVQTNMEGVGYAFGPVVLPAASVGAPHQRHRIFFVADASGDDQRRAWESEQGQQSEAGGCGPIDGLANAAGVSGPEHEHKSRLGPWREKTSQNAAERDGVVGGVANTDSHGQSGRGIQRPGEGIGSGVGASLERPKRFCKNNISGQADDFWRNADWLGCKDGKWRPVEPGTFPLAHGVANRVGKLRSYGNAIVPQVAAAFIRAYMEGEAT